MIRKEDVVKIGQFIKPHGIKGEIAMVTTYDVFDEPSDDLYLFCEIDGILVPFFIEEYRSKTETIKLIKLENVDTEAQAAEFANLEIFYPIDVLDELPVEDLSWSHFIGYRIIDAHHGAVGIVTDVDDSTMNVLLQVDANGKELLLPAVEELIQSIDRENGELFVSLPDGLLNL